MKKFFMFAAMASVALVSCVKNEPAITGSENGTEILFETPVLSPSVKAATEYHNDFNKNIQIGLWARWYGTYTEGNISTEGVFEYTTFDEGELYMGKAQGGLPITYNETFNAWKHQSKNYYWPKNGSLTFNAYAPYNAKNAALANNTPTGITFTNYVVPTTPSQQEDLLYSERVYNKTAIDADPTTPYKGVALPFNHALSSIQFKVKTAADFSTTQLTLTKIELLNVVSKGSFNQSLVDGNNKTAEDGVWTLSTDPGDKVIYSVDIPEGGILLDPTDYRWAENGTYDKNTASNGLRETDLILLPQPLANCDLRITYKLINDQMSDPITIQLTTDLTAAAVPAWLEGRRYTYLVTIGLDEIYFEPIVTPWENHDVTQNEY